LKRVGLGLVCKERGCVLKLEGRRSKEREEKRSNRILKKKEMEGSKVKEGLGLRREREKEEESY
jgi:hypothetical protein